jgi:hypothetical protein
MLNKTQITAVPYFLKTPRMYIRVMLTYGEVIWWELVSRLPSAESEWVQHDTQNIRMQWTQAESVPIVFTVCTTSKQLLCATRLSNLNLYKNNVCAEYCIWVMPGLNLDRDIDYPEYFSWTFSVPLQANSGIVPTMRPCLLPSTSFTIHFHHTFIWGLHCTSSVAYTDMKYKQQI